MISTILRRLAIAPAILFAVSVFAFNLPALSGLDPTTTVLRARLGERAPDPEILASVEQQLGLDADPVTRYGLWLRHAVKGDLGSSFVSRADVGSSVRRAAGVSLSLVAGALAIAFTAGALLAAAAVRRVHGRFDRALSTACQMGVAVPEYAVAPVLVLLFAVNLRLLPSSGWASPASVVLPVVTLAVPGIAFCAQLIRAELIDALQHPSSTVSLGRGVGRARLRWRHALPQALTGAMEILGLWLVGLLGGAVIVEVIFAIPGLGRLLYTAVRNADVPMIQGGILATVGIALIVFLSVDLARTLIDPRSRRAA